MRGGDPVLADVRAEGRAELSAISLENAVAKAANVLLDEFDLEAGATLGIDLPPHWQRVVWTLAAWTVGAVVRPGSGGDIALLITHAGAIPPDARGPVGLVSLHPLGLSEPVVAGTESLADLARLAPDALLAPDVEESAVALEIDGEPLRSLTQGECLVAARRQFDRPGRVLLFPDALASADAWILPAVGPALPGVSVVIADPMTDIDAVIRSEGISWTLPASPGM